MWSNKTRNTNIQGVMKVLIIKAGKITRGNTFAADCAHASVNNIGARDNKQISCKRGLFPVTLKIYIYAESR